MYEKVATIQNGNTTIQVQVKTRESLKKIGRKGESYDDLVRRLLQQEQEVENE